MGAERERNRASEVTISQRGARRARGPHAWIYESDVVSAKAANGDVVRVRGPRGRDLGTAFYSSSSRIALRFVDRGRLAVDADFWRTRFEAAAAYRESLSIDADAYRLVHADADRVPGLVVDRYGDCLVVQFLCKAVENRASEIVTALREQFDPAAIVARNDSRARRLEGLRQDVAVLHGEVPSPLHVRDGAVRMEVDLLAGQKTGLFLDQRENRAAARRYAQGRLLDCFSYHGAFALQLAEKCTEVIALDISKDAVAAIERNAALNQIALEARVVNVFDHLRELQDRAEQFDTIVLDPPAFAKNKKALPSALKGYKDINLRALKLLRPGGVLVTASCSYHVDDAAFVDIVTRAAGDVRVELAVIEQRTQSRDHPTRLGMPETGYLKCLILRRLS